MCLYLGNDIVLGNLFLKLVEKEITEIACEEIYDFLYYVSSKMNEKQNTVLLVSKEGIYNFIKMYNGFLQLKDDRKHIEITNKEGIKENFPEFYGCYVEKYRDYFLNAINLIDA